jgi:peptidyl-prolyl cis-trans isomerase C
MPSRRAIRRSFTCAAAGALALLGWLRASHAHPTAPRSDDGVALPRARPAAPVSAEEQARRAEVVVRFDSGQLTVGQVEDAILGKNPFMQQRYMTSDAVRSLLERSLRFELLAAEAQRRGYDKHKVVVHEVKQNEVHALIRDEFDSQLTADSIPAAEVKAYYDSHHDEFARPETRRASVLWAATEAEAQALSAQAHAAADLRAFRELVRSKNGDAGLGQRGVEMRYFDAHGKVFEPSEADTSLDPALAQGVFALKNLGDTSAVLKTESGFAIARLAGVRPAQTETLAQAEQRIRMRLWRERRDAAIDAKLASLRKETQTEVHPELIDAVKLDAAPAAPTQGLPEGFPHTR